MLGCRIAAAASGKLGHADAEIKTADMGMGRRAVEDRSGSGGPVDQIRDYARLRGEIPRLVQLEPLHNFLARALDISPGTRASVADLLSDGFLEA